MVQAYGRRCLRRTRRRECGERQCGGDLVFPCVMKIVAPPRSSTNRTRASVRSSVLKILSKNRGKTGLRADHDERAEASTHPADSSMGSSPKHPFCAMHRAEAILGMNRYAVGPLIMFGLGGIPSSLKDVVFRLAPVDRDKAHQMVGEIKGYKLFTGFKGRPKSDVGITKGICGLKHGGQPSGDHGDRHQPPSGHEEGKGATVADCRIILKNGKE